MPVPSCCGHLRQCSCAPRVLGSRDHIRSACLCARLFASGRYSTRSTAMYIHRVLHRRVTAFEQPRRARSQGQQTLLSLYIACSDGAHYRSMSLARTIARVASLEPAAPPRRHSTRGQTQDPNLASLAIGGARRSRRSAAIMANSSEGTGRAASRPAASSLSWSAFSIQQLSSATREGPATRRPQAQPATHCRLKRTRRAGFSILHWSQHAAHITCRRHSTRPFRRVLFREALPTEYCVMREMPVPLRAARARCRPSGRDTVTAPGAGDQCRRAWRAWWGRVARRDSHDCRPVARWRAGDS